MPIRDASVLIVVRFGDDRARVLMGKRHDSHAFMPGRVVFPGGRVDRADLTLAHGGALPQSTEELLLERIRGARSPRRARSFALAAIRETYEETGVLIGTPSSRKHPTRSDGWRGYFANQVVPDVSGLHFIARAITPPGLVRRFDTRFFAANAQCIAAIASPPTSELVELSWLTFEEARTEPLPTITRRILDLVESRLQDLFAGTLNGARPLFMVRHGRLVVEMLGARSDG